MTKKTIGIIGVGSMGGPIAANLLDQGHPLLIYDVNPAALQPLIDGGANSSISPREIADQTDLIILSLPTLEAVRNVTIGSEGLLNGSKIKTCVNFSTTGPDIVREIAQTLGLAGITLMDCPITGGALAARDATLSITVSGDQATYNRIKPLLDSVASDVFYVGTAPGQAQIMKLLNNMLSFSAFVASCEAFAIGVKAGLDPDVMVEVINAGTGRNSATTHKFPNNILPRTFDYGAKMMISFKDISLCLDEAQRLGVPLWLAPVIKQVIGFAISQDGDSNDVSTLVKHYEKWCGIEIAGVAARTPKASS
jgi:3-hydroxyisobutyrate dehydrogenase-like beta-hydroxyacid dehydrogenase